MVKFKVKIQLKEHRYRTNQMKIKKKKGILEKDIKFKKL